jgi:two-component system sensor histidine kinase AdeS
MRGMPFRWQLTLIMSACVIVTVCMALGTTSGLMMRQDARYEASLSVEAQRAKHQIDAGRPVTNLAAANELLLRRVEQYGAYTRLKTRGVVTVALVSVLLGGIMAALLSARLSRPLLGISNAAGQVAAGQLSARAPLDHGAASEIRSLIDDFNSMAQSIESSHRQMTETSAAIAHELRTPVAILRGRMEGMREGLFEWDETTISI